ncbi:Wzz/FepE/Etk N-terminal domain-containing protein [Erwinia rhapontici]|uniref:Wzz/FepE/Etk N-terminal domain-containing protein n=1 Tax=Erwinia rhapontici TaxID=55212 RepID=UPI003BA362F2
MKRNNKCDTSKIYSERSHLHDKELDLMEAAYKLWKGKWIVIGVIFISLACAIIYISLPRNKWISTAIVTQPDVGQVVYYSALLNRLYPENKGILPGGPAQDETDKAPSGDIQRQIFRRFIAIINGEPDTVKIHNRAFKVTTSTLDKQLPYPVKISLTADSASQAQQQLSRYIDEANKALLDQYIGDINSNIEIKITELKESLNIQQKIAMDRHEQYISELVQMRKVAVASGITESAVNPQLGFSDKTLFLFGEKTLTAMIDNESAKTINYGPNYYDIQTQLLMLSQLKPKPQYMKTFNYVVSPDLPLQPAGSKKSLVLILAVILGAIVGSIIVIARNVIQSFLLHRRTMN